MPNLIVGLSLAIGITTSARAWTDINTWKCGVWDVLINMEQEGLFRGGTCDDLIYGCLDWGNEIVSCEDVAYDHCSSLLRYDNAQSAAKNVFDIDYKTPAICDQGCEIGEYITEESSCLPCESGMYGNGFTCSECPAHQSGIVESAISDGDIHDCYVPSTATWSFSDTAGSGTARFTTDCHYF